MVEYMKPLSTSLRYDGMGSIIAAHGSSGPRVMVDAHMDELGGMIRRVTPNGFLTMQMLGGWLDQALVDQRWVILGSKGPVHAVTGIRDIHVMSPEERNRMFSREQLYLDVGAKNEAEVGAMGISPGDPVVPDSPFTVLNGTDNYLAESLGRSRRLRRRHRSDASSSDINHIRTRSSGPSPPRKRLVLGELTLLLTL